MDHSRFITNIKAEKINEHWKLLDDLVYYSEILQATITVPAGFETDFASVPRIPLAYLIAGNTAHGPAVVHDYQYRKGDVTREQADDIFYEGMKADNDPAAGWRRWLMWAAVRSAGWTIWNRYRRGESRFPLPDQSEPELHRLPYPTPTSDSTQA